MPLSAKEYIGLINKVQDYIESQLDQNMTMPQLAEVACFSEYYFNRLYRLVTDESVYGFIKRLRLERSAFKLIAAKDESITEIALSVGFGNSSSFAKAFKQKYGISASDYRKSKNGQVIHEEHFYNKGMDFRSYYNHLTEVKPIAVDIKKLEQRDVIYIRHKGAYKGDGQLFQELFTRLYTWAQKETLITEATQWLTLYHDFGVLSDEDDYRVSVCMTVEGSTKISEDVGTYTISGGLYAIARFEVDTKGYQEAWDYMFLNWLPQSGYIHDDRFTFEAYPKIRATKEGCRVMEVCIPIKGP